MNSYAIKCLFFFLIPLFLGVIYLILGYVVSRDFYFSAIGFFCLLAMAPALVFKPLELFEPVVLIYAATIIGGTARALLLSHDGYYSYDFIMQGYTLEPVYENGWLLVIGVFSFSIGYLYVKRRFDIERRVPLIRAGINEKKLRVAVGLCAMISVLGSALYVGANGIEFSNISSISNKRAALVGDDVYTAHGYYTMLSAFSEYALYVVFAYCLFFSKKIAAQYKIIIFFLFLLSVFVPFVSSSRMDILLILINMGIIFYYSKGRKVPVKSLVLLVFFSFLLASVMGVLRSEAQGRESHGADNPIVAVVASGNFVDIVRFSVIVEEMPEKLSFMYGSSLISWVVAPIPRVVWPEKPSISLGPVVREFIYDLPTRNNGFPPGIYAEGYMNFGYIGILLVPFFFGMILRFLYNTFKPLLSIYPIALIFFVGFIWRFSFGAIGLNFSQALVQVLTDLVALFIICFYVKKGRVHEA